MPKVKNGDTFSCSSCGLMVEVVDPCGCSDCGIICCDTPMERNGNGDRKKSARRKRTNSSKRGRHSRS